MQPCEVKQLDKEAEAAWDDFVGSCPAATFFHWAGWKRVVEQSLGHRAYYLYAQDSGEIRGVLPLVHIKSRLFANALISNAFCVQGGPAATDPAAREALEASAIELARSLGVDYLEFRLRDPGPQSWPSNDDLYVSFRKSLDPEPEANLRAIPRKQRAMVRKAIKHGLESHEDENLDTFYQAYSVSVRNLGTPVLPRRFFEALKQVFGPACRVLTVTDRGRAVSSVLSFYFRDEVLPYYGGGTEDARRVAGNDFMYWELMRRACGEGIRVFDFGRSKRGTGAFSFKRHWGFEPEPLIHAYPLLRGASMPAFNPTNPKYGAAIALWRRLPLGIANFIGPYIAKDLA